MIRLLFIGPDASTVATVVSEVAPAAEVVAERLPAGAVRNFEAVPADAVIFCWAAPDRRLARVVDVIQGLPVGGLVPAIVVAPEDDLDLPVDATISPDADAATLVATIADLLGIEVSELESNAGADDRVEESPRELQKTPSAVAAVSLPTSATSPLDANVLETKLRQVRHDSYFEVLELPQEVERQTVREAFLRLQAQFADEAVPRELAREYATELDEIREALEDAFVVLSDEDLRIAHVEGPGRLVR